MSRLSAILTSVAYLLLLNLILFNSQVMQAQEELPFYTIPEYPEKYDGATVAARMIEGLGFRYHWATEGLRDQDLNYQVDSTARTCNETLDHLLGLSEMIVNAITLKTNIRPAPERELSFENKRKETLMNLKQASEILRKSDSSQLHDYEIKFKRGDNNSSFPFWHNINGPIADALWHCGQIVMMRRASGNPFDSRANVFRGSVRAFKK